MSKQLKILLVTVFGLLIAGGVAFGLSKVLGATEAAGAAEAHSVILAKGEPKTSDGGGVTIEVSFVPPTEAANALLFEVSLSTHSVELGEYDLEKLSQVTLQPGGALAEVEWKPQGPGEGHHVTGMLTVKDPKGLLAAAKMVGLELRDIAGVPVREFEWQVDKR